MAKQVWRWGDKYDDYVVSVQQAKGASEEGERADWRIMKMTQKMVENEEVF